MELHVKHVLTIKHLIKINIYHKLHVVLGFKYQEFGPMFKAEFFNATQWAEIVEGSGGLFEHFINSLIYAIHAF